LALGLALALEVVALRDLDVEDAGKVFEGEGCGKEELADCASPMSSQH
jgi:hypothetical protein